MSKKKPKEILELKSIITGMQNVLDSCKSRSGARGERRINEFEAVTILKMIKSGKQKD